MDVKRIYKAEYLRNNQLREVLLEGRDKCVTCGLIARMMGDMSASMVAESFRTRALAEKESQTKLQEKGKEQENNVNRR